MATTPSFTSTPIIGTVQISTANTNRDGTGTLGNVVTGSTSGTRVDRITITATGTTTAGMVRLYIYDGTNTRLWKEVAVLAATPSSTVQAFASVLLSAIPGFPLLMLPNNYILKASTNNSETFNVFAEGGNL